MESGVGEHDPDDGVDHMQVHLQPGAMCEYMYTRRREQYAAQHTYFTDCFY